MFLPFRHKFHAYEYTPSPCLSLNWKAFTSLKISSTDLPTGKSLTDECLIIPFPSIIKRPRSGIPDDSIRTPYSLAMVLVKSDSKGYFICPIPPS